MYVLIVLALAVAEQIPRDAHAGIDVLPVRHVLDRVKIPRGREWTGGNVLCIDPRVEEIEAHAVVHGESIDAPLILGEEAHVVFQRFMELNRRRVLR